MESQAIITLIIIPAIGWIGVVVFNQGRQNAVIKTDIGYMKQDIQHIKDSQLEMKSMVNLFLKNEIDTLKELARRP
jgi:hypothetical protein